MKVIPLHDKLCEALQKLFHCLVILENIFSLFGGFVRALPLEKGSLPSNIKRLACFGLLQDRSNPSQGWMSRIFQLALELGSQGHGFPKETVLRAAIQRKLFV